MKKTDKIFLAGHNGLVGFAFYEELKKKGYNNIKTINKDKLDLTKQEQVEKYFKNQKFDHVILCAAKVGGILNNNENPWDFIFINTAIQLNILYCSLKYKVKKVCILGSSCIYPKFSKIPIKESYLLGGYLEKTNEKYALSKILGLKMAESLIIQKKMDIRTFMPCNLFGKKDKFFDERNNHVIPAMIRRFDKAKDNKRKYVKIWGTGKPLREFAYANDLAKNIIECLLISKKKFFSKIGDDFFYNVGSNQEITIKNLAKKISKLVGFNGKIIFDKTKPDGTFRKYISKNKIMRLHQLKNTNFDSALKKTYLYYLNEKRKRS